LGNDRGFVSYSAYKSDLSLKLYLPFHLHKLSNLARHLYLWIITLWEDKGLPVELTIRTSHHRKKSSSLVKVAEQFFPQVSSHGCWWSQSARSSGPQLGGELLAAVGPPALGSLGTGGNTSANKARVMTPPSMFHAQCYLCSLFCTLQNGCNYVAYHWKLPKT